MAYQKKMSVIESAEKRMNDELRQHDLGLDNADDIRYWAAYLDGANAQLREDKSRIADVYWDACMDGRVRKEDEHERMHEETA